MLTAPAHAVTVIATTRVTPTALLKVEPARQRQLRLEEGLGSPDAQIVLRELDDDGHLGLRDAPDELLDGLRQHTRGFPRALEAVKAILDGDATLTPRDLLDRTRHLPEDQVVQVLVGEAYELLDAPAQQVMQALAVYPAPVSAVGVDFLLRPVNPTTDAAPILTRLVRRQLVRFQDGHYYLHPVDRDYARSQLPAGSPGDSPAAFTLTGLQARAADYYAQIRTPRESWRTLEDVRPQLAEFELRCDTGDYDTAATVLADIDFDYLRVWGHYRTLVDLHGRIHGRITDPALNATHLTNLGLCHASLGDYRQAIDLHTQALAIARDIGDRQGEGAALGNLGICHCQPGRLPAGHRPAHPGPGHRPRHRRPPGRGRRAGQPGDLPLQPGRLPAGHRPAHPGPGHRPRHRRPPGRGHRAGQPGDLPLQPGRLPAGHRPAHPGPGHRPRHRRPPGRGRPRWATWGSATSAWATTGRPSTCTPRPWPSPATSATATARRTRLDYLGRAWLASGDARQAVTLLEQAVSIADTTGDIEPAVKARSGLARAQLQLGDPAAALAAAAARRELPYPAEEPAMRLLEGLALLELHRAEESVRAFSDARHGRRRAAGPRGQERCRAAGPGPGAERTRRGHRRPGPGHGGG